MATKPDVLKHSPTNPIRDFIPTHKAMFEIHGWGGGVVSGGTLNPKPYILGATAHGSAGIKSCQLAGVSHALNPKPRG